MLSPKFIRIQFKNTNKLLHLVSNSRLLKQKNCCAAVCSGSIFTNIKLNYSHHHSPWQWKENFQLPAPELDWEFLLDRNNTDAIEANILSRKGIGDIRKVIKLSKLYVDETETGKKDLLRNELVAEALKIPNMSHKNCVVGGYKKAKVLEEIGEKKDFSFPPFDSSMIATKALRSFRYRNIVHATEAEAHFLEGDLARLERALIALTVDELLSRGFELITVPDLIHAPIIESCGFETDSESRVQVYKLHPHIGDGACLSATSEMAIAGYFMNSLHSFESLPIRVMAVSSCYRAEATTNSSEKGMFRANHFTKAEMFACTANETGDESSTILDEFLDIEKTLFSKLGLHFRILDMPSEELGSPASKKYDIESYMYGRKRLGEISSCSNCTDYQSRRLNIKYKSPDGKHRHVQTVNGTACAVPRMITSILEQYQKKYWVDLPEILHSYMGQTQLRGVMGTDNSVFLKSSSSMPKHYVTSSLS